MNADLEAILDAAKAHGEEGDPDHEVGDLQDLARIAWDVMTPEQRRIACARYAETHEVIA